MICAGEITALQFPPTIAGAPRHDLRDAGRRQIPADHGRPRPGEIDARGLTPTDRANAVNAEFLDDPKSRIPLCLAVQTPERRVVSCNSLVNTPVSVPFSLQGDPGPGLLGNVATLTRTRMPTNADQASNQPVYEVYTNVQGRDLRSVAGQIDRTFQGCRRGW